MTDSDSVQAWEADHSHGPRPEAPDRPLEFVPVGAGIARLATRCEIFRALLWPVPKSTRNGVLPTFVIGIAVCSAVVLWLIEGGSFWILLSYTCAATILAIVGWAAVTAHSLSKPEQQMLISSHGDAMIGLKIVRGDSPHVEIHSHYATPVGAGAGRRFRTSLLPYVKEFVTEIEPDMAIQFVCPDAPWQQVAGHVGESFPQWEGWRVERVKNKTMISHSRSIPKA